METKVQECSPEVLETLEWLSQNSPRYMSFTFEKTVELRNGDRLVVKCGDSWQNEGEPYLVVHRIEAWTGQLLPA
jgi:hypothetical protein